MKNVNFNSLSKQLNRLKITVKGLCVPAQLYLAISTLSIFLLFIQNFKNITNLGKQNFYQCGMYKHEIKMNCLVFFLVKIVYVVLWTWILQYLCSSGHTNVSWFLVLLPYIFMFILITVITFSVSKA
jgi:hypothetical protein